MILDLFDLKSCLQLSYFNNKSYMFKLQVSLNLRVKKIEYFLS